MNLFAYFHDVVIDSLNRLAERGDLSSALEFGNVSVEPPRDPAHGDVSTNAAMVLAKAAGMAPRALAGLLADEIGRHADVAGVEVAGPGFLNLRLQPAFWPRVVAAVLEAGEDYGCMPAATLERINVEYVSANPTGPLHVGHCRGAVFGDALANLLEKAGHAVTREYYINDAGAQIETLAHSAFVRYREALGEALVEIPSGLYPGDYLKPVGQALADRHGPALLAMAEEEWLPIVRQAAIAMMMESIRLDLKSLNIEHDVFFSEASLSDPERDRIAETIARLRAKDLIYQGRLPPPKGQPPEDWEDREQTLFRATLFGDDIDRPLMKSDGGYTYFASDIAYHLDKFDRGFRTMIDVWGADHSGYVKRMQSAVKAISDETADLDVKICQLVRLYRGGEPVKMSKRAGEFVTLRDVVDEVGRDPVRFMMLYRKNDAPLDFDFKKVTEQSRENPVFYVQYAHARIHSVFRNAGEALPGVALNEAALRGARLDRLSDESELTLVRRLAAYPRVLQSAASAHEPHRVAFYLYDLASEFHALWNKGKELSQLRFILSDDMDATLARLALLKSVANVISGGLAILGVAAPTEMR